MKAFGRIAESPLPLDMAPVLDRLLTELTSYLRKSNRLLRQAALAAIEVCISITSSSVLCFTLICTVTSPGLPLLHLAHMVLRSAAAMAPSRCDFAIVPGVITSAQSKGLKLRAWELASC